MYCVIQEVRRKKPDPYGEYKEIEAYQDSWTIDGKPPAWSWRYTGGRFERPHLEAYKITSVAAGGVTALSVAKQPLPRSWA